MRGVRGSHSYGDENIRQEINQRRQIILNQYYNKTLDDNIILNDSLQTKEDIVSPERVNKINQSEVKGRGLASLSYGRGALWNSDLGGKLKSQRSASMCSDTSSNDGIPKGRGAILLSHISSQYSTQSERKSQVETKDFSDRESLNGLSSRLGLLSSKIKSVSEMESCTESETDSLSRNERRRQAKLNSANPNPYSNSNKSVPSSNRQIVHSDSSDISDLSKPLRNYAAKTSSLQTSNRDKPCDISSGNESSVSEVSIIAASLRGQGQFKSGRLPRDATSNTNQGRR